MTLESKATEALAHLNDMRENGTEKQLDEAYAKEYEAHNAFQNSKK